MMGEEVNRFSNETKFLLHYPSLFNIKNNQIRENLENYFISYSSINNQLHSMNNNFRNNIQNYNYYIDDLEKQFMNKDLYIIAAGPSLDMNFRLLKNVGENSIIIATGTVLKKLMNAGIKPDYIIIIDANELVYRQIEGMEDVGIPLLGLSTVYHKVFKNYLGSKYLICQEGFKKAENYAFNNNFKLYKSGGSVSTTALEIGIQFKCNRIIFVGLDLAYTNNYDHALDTPLIEKVTGSTFRQIKDNNGDWVNTSRNMDIYRKWIENRIKDVSGIQIINATEGGAKIEGMIVDELKNLI
jgi:hypothetical protein